MQNFDNGRYNSDSREQGASGMGGVFKTDDFAQGGPQKYHFLVGRL